ncbi:MAG: ABC transporter permease [Planctomycetota bacterium]
MKPYLAIIIDSFHSALSSRILWVAFAAIWVFLLGIAPIGFREDYTTEFRWFDLENGTQRKAMLARGLVDPDEEDTALGRVARAFPSDLQRKLRRVVDRSDIRIDKRDLAKALNDALNEESWYDAETWKSTPRLRELRELDEIADDDIAEPQRKRRARLRIEAALPGVFAAQSAQTITLQYLGYDFPARFAIGKAQFKTLVNQLVIPILMNWLLGLALVFLGVLVTASILPDMLQPGSLHLLLSKPISRTKLLLAKYVGGCAFVFLCVSQIMVGLWLVAGARLDLWNARFLLCIPVLVLLFAVYYSVSILAGLFWRSPVLSIGIACMFGAFLFVIGFVGQIFDAQVTNPDKIRSFAFLDDQMVISTAGRGPKRFDADSGKWVQLIEGVWPVDYIVPPLAIDEGKALTARIRGGRMNLYGSGSLDLLVLDAENDFDPRPSLRLPVGTRHLYQFDDSIIALNNMGLTMTSVQTVLDSVRSEDDDKEDDDESANGGGSDVQQWVKDLLRMQGGATEEFRSISPRGVSFSDPVRVNSIPSQRSFVVYTYGRVVRLTLPATDATPGSRCEVASEHSFDGDGSVPVVMATSGDAVVVIRKEEPIRWLDADSLEVLAECERPDDQRVISIRALGDSTRFAMLTTDGRAHYLRLADGEIVIERLPQRDVSCIDFDPQQNRLVVAHHIDQVDFFDADGVELVGLPDQALRPSVETWRTIDKYVLSPLQVITPRTMELGNTMSALVSGESSLVADTFDDQDYEQLKVAGPILSCVTFTVVMLAISCVYFVRRDF